MAELVHGGGIPHVLHGVQEDYKKLYYSDPTAALKVPVTISPGFGVLKMGTAIAVNTSAAGNIGKFVPYDPTATITGAETAPGRAYLVQDSAATTTCFVTLNDSYKFVVGDQIIVIDANTSAKTLSSITAIDRTTYTHMAQISFTTTNTTDFTTAQFAYIAHYGYDACVGILERSVDTGVGANAKGALATLVISNCILYTGMLLNFDSNAQTDLSASAFGNFMVIK